MKLPSARRQRREGAIVPLAAVLLTSMLGMMAFAIDVGWIVKTHSELQNAADAAALAGATAIQPYYVNYYATPSSNATARTDIISAALTAAADPSATHAAGANNAGNTSGGIKVDITNDVKLGYLTSAYAFTYYGDGSYPANTFPNTVEVTLRLDGGASTNANLNLFFGLVWGHDKTNVTATARATIMNAVPTKLPDEYLIGSSGLLPITVDVAAWKSFVSTGIPTVSEAKPGGGTYYDVTFPTSTAPKQLGDAFNGTQAVPGGPTLTLFPNPMDGTALAHSASFKEPYLNLVNPPTNSGSALRNWWRNGPSAADIASLHFDAGNGVSQIDANGMLPIAQATPVAVDYSWKTQPGNRWGTSDLPAEGTVHMIPVYAHATPASVLASGNDPSQYANVSGSGPTFNFDQGNGQDFWFNIVGFVPVLVIKGKGDGQLDIQPTSVTLPTTSFPTSGSGAPAPAPPPPPDSPPVSTFAPCKLTY